MRAGRGAELQWNKTIRVIHHVSTFLGFTRYKIISFLHRVLHTVVVGVRKNEVLRFVLKLRIKEDMPLENAVRSYGDMIDRHGNKIYLG